MARWGVDSPGAGVTSGVWGQKVSGSPARPGQEWPLKSPATYSTRAPTCVDT